MDLDAAGCRRKYGFEKKRANKNRVEHAAGRGRRRWRRAKQRAPGTGTASTAVREHDARENTRDTAHLIPAAAASSSSGRTKSAADQQQQNREGVEDAHGAGLD